MFHVAMLLGTQPIQPLDHVNGPVTVDTTEMGIVVYKMSSIVVSGNTNSVIRVIAVQAYLQMPITRPPAAVHGHVVQTTTHQEISVSHT